MAVEFGPLQQIPGNNGLQLSRTASPEGFVVGLKTLKDVKPTLVAVRFAPVTERPEGSPLLVQWHKYHQQLVTVEGGRSTPVSEERLRELAADGTTNEFRFDIQNSGSNATVEKGLEVFTTDLLTPMTEEGFLPRTGLILGFPGKRQYKIDYEAETLKLHLPDPLGQISRRTLTHWMEELPNQQ